MGLPRQPPPGHGPFGEKAFRVALAGCVVLLVLGAVLIVVADGALGGAGTALVVLGGLGLGTSGLLLLAERLLGRRPRS